MNGLTVRLFGLLAFAMVMNVIAGLDERRRDRDIYKSYRHTHTDVRVSALGRSHDEYCCMAGAETAQVENGQPFTYGL